MPRLQKIITHPMPKPYQDPKSKCLSMFDSVNFLKLGYSFTRLRSLQTVVVLLVLSTNYAVDEWVRQLSRAWEIVVQFFLPERIRNQSALILSYWITGRAAASLLPRSNNSRRQLQLENLKWKTPKSKRSLRLLRYSPAFGIFLLTSLEDFPTLCAVFCGSHFEVHCPCIM